MVDKADFAKALELVNNSQKILITTHQRPDGDACGPVRAVSKTLLQQGKAVEALFLSEIPSWYRFLFAKEPNILNKNVTLDELKTGRLIEPDLIIIIDTNSTNQLPGFDEYLRQTDCPVLVIDHHLTGHHLGDIELLDSSAAAAGLIVYDFFCYAGWEIDSEIANSLFVAIATDTGWFQFGNTDERALKTCSQLCGFGVIPAEIYKKLYLNYSYSRIKLKAAMLNNLKLLCNGRLALQYISLQDFERTGAEFNDTENLIDECRQIGTIEVAALLVELGSGEVKLSLRSTGSVDVKTIAQSFGGGGHVNAAGANLACSLQNALDSVVEAVVARIS